MVLIVNPVVEVVEVGKLVSFNVGTFVNESGTTRKRCRSRKQRKMNLVYKDKINKLLKLQVPYLIIKQA